MGQCARSASRVVVGSAFAFHSTLRSCCRARILRCSFRLISALSRGPESPLPGTRSRRLQAAYRRGRLLHVWRSGSNGTVAPPRAGSVGRDVSPPLVSAVVGPIDTVPSPVSVRKPPQFRGKSWTASPIACSSETRILQDFLGTLGIPRSACHAEGRGFESHQPLSKRPAFAGLFRLRSRVVRLRSSGLKAD